MNAATDAPHLDPDQARQWLDSPSPEEPACTVAEDLGVHDDFGYTELGFENKLHDLVADAAEAGLFGGWRVGLWPVWDSDATTDSAIVTVDVPALDRLRVATPPLGFRELVIDRTATGYAAALAVLAAVAEYADNLVYRVSQTLRAGR